jgi:hypothetical protein
MSRPCARFFAADWEASSFLEFFVDLQLRVAEDPRGGVGRTIARLSDHARFALQLTLVRSVDSFIASLAELTLLVKSGRKSVPWHELVCDKAAEGHDRHPLWRRWDVSIPVDLGSDYATYLAYGNVRQLDRLFVEETEIPLFVDQDELERISRLSSLRNLIAHGRIFAAEDLTELVEETASVTGLRLDLKDLRSDLDLLRIVISRVDSEAAVAWHIERPITSAQLFEAISKASVFSDKGPSTPPHRDRLR